MRPIPQKLKERLNADKSMHVCIHNNRRCCDEFGNKPARAEWEHAYIYAGKQVNEWWAIIGVCWYHHRGPGLEKDYNRYRCLVRMTNADLDEAHGKYPKFNWTVERNRLIKKYELFN